MLSLTLSLQSLATLILFQLKLFCQTSIISDKPNSEQELNQVNKNLGELQFEEDDEEGYYSKVFGFFYSYLILIN